MRDIGSIQKSRSVWQIFERPLLTQDGLTDAGSHKTSRCSAGRTEPSTVPTDLTQDTPTLWFELELFHADVAIILATSSRGRCNDVDSAI